MPFMDVVFLEDGRVLRPCGDDDLVGVSQMVLAEAGRSIAGDFNDMGWSDFEEYLSTGQLLKRLVTGSKALIIQEEDDEISGYLEISGNQVLLLFIAEKAQRLGLASKLLNRMRDTLDLNELYVNSSTAGYEFYRNQQFEPIKDWKQKAGVKYRELKWQKQQK
ncbi:GNAT family N-acetyltransferase [Kiloniella sp.]|uniref:GNAT family N-acetyltransferase n=1 Tax=Kiloniella sp. TaxID=1938587 RepID=UPI003B02883B